jgi:hypothetical protein
MADTKKIIISVEFKEKGAKATIDKTSNSVENLSSKVTVLTQAQKEQIISDEKSAIQKKQLIASLKAQAAAQMAAASSSKQLRATSGLNNAILLETSRLASDASYGFQGISNNLGQLISLFQISSQNAGGFAATLKSLGRDLLGTGGILIGIQLLISFLPKIEKLFKKSKTAVEEETEALKKNNEEMAKNIAKRKLLAGQVEEIADSFTDNFIVNFKNGLNLLQSTDKSLQEISFRFGEIGVKNAEIIEDETIANDARLEIAFRLLDIFREESKQKKLRLEQDKILQKSQEELTKQDELNLKDLTQRIIESRTAIDEFQKEVTRLRKRGVVLTPPDEDDTGAELRRFKQKLIDLSRLQLQFDKAAAIEKAVNAQQQLDIDEEFARKEADRRVAVFKERESKRLEEFKEQVKDRKDANELIADAEREFQESIIDAETKHKNVLLSIENAFIEKRISLKDKEGRAINKINRSIENTEIDRLKFSLDANQTYYDSKIAQVENDIGSTQSLIDNAEKLGFSELQLNQLRQDIFNLDNQRSDLSLQKEIDFINEKTRINLEYVGFAQGISQLLGTIAGENEAMQKAALLVEKGAAIANVVIKTQASNLATRVQSAAVAPPPANAPFIALGEAQVMRNNIGAGIAIANILATTISSFKKPSAGGVGGGAGANVQVEAPDFNVVGASPESQLVGSILPILSKPMKAFVVESEITDAQNNVKNYKNAAST